MDRKGKNASDKTKRGFVTHYLVSLDEQQLFENTLTGALIKLIRENGPLTVDDIILYIGHSYDLLRNSKGQTYNSDCRKAIQGALCSNGLFDKSGLQAAFPTLSKKREGKAAKKELSFAPSQRWKIKDEEAEVFE